MSVLSLHRCSRASLLAECLEHRRIRQQTREYLDQLAMVLRSEQDRAQHETDAQTFSTIADSVEAIRRRV